MLLKRLNSNNLEFDSLYIIASSTINLAGKVTLTYIRTSLNPLIISQAFFGYKQLTFREMNQDSQAHKATPDRVISE
jgi:hypothetical protein